MLKKENILLKVSKDFKNEVKELANSRNTNVTQFIIYLINDYKERNTVR